MSKPLTKTKPPSSIRTSPVRKDAALTDVQRMPSEERRLQILNAAIDLLCESGDGLHTRTLAKRLGVSHALLFKYFSSKSDILDAVFQTVYIDRFPEPLSRKVETASEDIPGKWASIYTEYAPRIFELRWVRIFVSTALNREPISNRYFELVVVPLVTRLAEDTERYCLGRVQKPNSILRAASLELAWTTHSALFYSGLRRWVYELPVNDNIVATMHLKIKSHFAGAKAVFAETSSIPDLRI
jgi:AcrR family transcriptional regulator